MIIWLLALVLLASLAGLGYRQGAIRVAFSLVGILFGAMLALPLARVVKPIIGVFGVKDPLLLWLVPPFIVFVLISAAFKIGAAATHHKVDVYYKYKAGDLRLALWERLNRRLGLCLGLVNATLYFILLSFVIHMFSYWTYQIATDDTDPKTLRLVNRMGKDLQSTGFIKVARALDSLPQSYFEAADIAGLVYHNSLLEARLSAYPPFLNLSERPEFQALGNDTQFIEMRQRREPIMSLIKHSTLQGVVNNPDALRAVWALLVPNMGDLRAYLETGKSPKYDPEPILGRWRLNPNSCFNMLRRSRGNMSLNEMTKWKRFIVASFNKVSCVAMTDEQLVLKELPSLKLPSGAPGTIEPPPQTLRGSWKSLNNGKYSLTFPGGGKENLAATAEADRLTFTIDGFPLVFNREI